jgi:hypothetical protein
MRYRIIEFEKGIPESDITKLCPIPFENVYTFGIQKKYIFFWKTTYYHTSLEDSISVIKTLKKEKDLIVIYKKNKKGYKYYE